VLLCIPIQPEEHKPAGRAAARPDRAEERRAQGEPPAGEPRAA